MDTAAMPSDGTVAEQLDVHEEPQLVSEPESAPVQEMVESTAMPSDGSAAEPSDCRKEPQLLNEPESSSSVNEPTPEPVSNPVTEQVIEPLGKPPVHPVDTAPESMPSLEMGFAVNGATIKVAVQRRPLGAEFSKRLTGPVKISKVQPNSHAAELGMKSGWIIKTVGGEDVSKKTLEQIQRAIKSGLSELPMQVAK